MVSGADRQPETFRPVSDPTIFETDYTESHPPAPLKSLTTFQIDGFKLTQVAQKSDAAIARKCYLLARSGNVATHTFCQHIA
jgi:hypothetical protein